MPKLCPVTRSNNETVRSSPHFLSVVVCTYNRCSKLESMLSRFSSQVVGERQRWELIVVDNRSTDATAEVISRAQRTVLYSLRYLYEARPGSSAAKNAGIRIANGNIIAFTDDDCLPQSDWVRSIIEAFERSPNLGGLGGRVELHAHSDLSVSIRTHRERVDPVPSDRLPSILPGCNMAFRRDVVERAGGFDPNFGAGAPIPSAEDLDFFYRCIRNGARLIYDPDIVLYHDHGRRLEADLVALRRHYLIGRGALYLKHIARCDWVVLRNCYWEVSRLLFGVVASIFKPKELRSNWETLLQLSYGAWLAARLGVPLRRHDEWLGRSPSDELRLN